MDRLVDDGLVGLKTCFAVPNSYDESGSNLQSLCYKVRSATLPNFANLDYSSSFAHICHFGPTNSARNYPERRVSP